MLTDILSGNYIWLIALLVAITIHEFSHAFAAEHLGDPTPRLMGRLTLNPLAHLDPLGTLFLLLVRFGWGKPVQFDPFNLKNPRRDSAIISLAGPVSNLLLALILALILRFVPDLVLSVFIFTLTTSGLFNLLVPIIFMNVILAVFNLLPIHPLDGFKVISGILPEQYVRDWNGLEGYGIFILIFLLLPFGAFSPLQAIMGPIINFLLKLLLGFGL